MGPYFDKNVKISGFCGLKASYFARSLSREQRWKKLRPEGTCVLTGLGGIRDNMFLCCGSIVVGLTLEVALLLAADGALLGCRLAFVNIAAVHALPFLLGILA